MKLATLFFIVGMLLMLLFFKTSFVSATQDTVDFLFLDTSLKMGKTQLYLYMGLFFVILFLTGFLISRVVHKRKRAKQLSKTSV